MTIRPPAADFKRLRRELSIYFMSILLRRRNNLAYRPPAGKLSERVEFLSVYQVLTGNLRPIRSSIWRTLAKLLPVQRPGMTIQELRGAWPDEENVPSENSLYQTLTRCGEKAGVGRSDGKPFEWWLMN